MLSVFDVAPQITTYTYDGLDWRTKTTFHDNTSTNYSYDAGNRITQIQEKNAAGTVTATITRTFDGLDRLTQEVTAQGTVSYTYDTACPVRLSGRGFWFDSPPVLMLTSQSEIPRMLCTMSKT